MQAPAADAKKIQIESMCLEPSLRNGLKCWLFHKEGEGASCHGERQTLILRAANTPLRSVRERRALPSVRKNLVRPKPFFDPIHKMIRSAALVHETMRAQLKNVQLGWPVSFPIGA